MTGNFEVIFDYPSPFAPADPSNSIDPKHKAFIHAIVFGCLAFLLALSIFRTIITNPGNIPEDKEWDMQTDSMAESSSQSSGGGGGSSDDGEVGFSSDS